MGYHVTILRTKGNKKIPILRNEIESFLKDHPKYRMAASKVGEFDLVFSREGKDTYQFVFQDGKLWSKNPEDDEIQTMIELASSFGARVRGDEFETFRTPTDTYHHPDDRDDIERSANSVRMIKQATRRSQWRLNLSLIVFFSVLVALVIYSSK